MKGYIVAVYEKINDNKILKEYAEKAGIAVKKYSGKAIITRKDHVSGTDRVAEVISKLSDDEIKYGQVIIKNPSFDESDFLLDW